MRTLPLLLLLGCEQDVGFGDPKRDDTGPWDTSPDTDDPIDTADTDGDRDDDGFTPEDGDCDDADPRVSPARDETDGDGKDNDCDGRIDEEWSGFTVAWTSYAGDQGGLKVLDTVGRLDDEIDFGGDCAPYFVANRPGGGWLVNCGLSALALVTPAGLLTELADFSGTDDGQVWGVAVGMDGTLYAAQPSSLVSVAEDGTVTTLAAWDSESEMYAVAVAVDPASGTVGVFDLLGGFATWDAATGLAIHRTMGSSLQSFSGAHKDGGGWYIPAYAADGTVGIYRWDDSAGDWVHEESWDDEDWTPYMLAIDGEYGSYYVSANASGIFPTVWRIVPQTNYAADFYMLEGDYAGYFWGLSTNY